MNTETNFHGIRHFDWDAIPKIIPGLVFLISIWGILLDSNYANQVWNTFEKQWFLWFGLIPFAYLVGLLADCFSWGLTSRVAVFFYNRYNNKKNKKNERNKPESGKWNEKLRVYASMTDRPESGIVGKTQIESRALANLLILIFVILVLLLVFWVIRGLHSLLYINLDSSSWKALILGIILVEIILFFASGFRQRRRVWGIMSILEHDEKKQPKILRG